MRQYHRAGHQRRLRAVLEVVLALVFWIVLAALVMPVIHRIGGVKKVKDLTPPLSMVAMFVMIAVMLPAALLAARVTGRRIGTLSSVKGRLRWRWLGTCLLAALAARSLQIALVFLGIATGDKFAGWSEFAPQLAIVFLLVPLQASAEEYFYRGSLMQAVGSFTRSAWLPAIVSTVAFTLSHGVRPEIIIAITAVGASSAWMTVRTGGLEATLAQHIVMNIGITAASAATTGLDIHHNDRVHWVGVAMSVALVAIYTAVIARLARRLPPHTDIVDELPAEPHA